MKIKNFFSFNFKQNPMASLRYVAGQSPITPFRRVTGQSPITPFRRVTGQSLIEVLLIVVLVTTVISGAVGFLIESYSMTQFISDQTVATYLGVEGIEVVKNLIDANYMANSPFNLGIGKGTYEVDYLSSGLENARVPLKNLFFDPQNNIYRYDSLSLSADAVESIYSRKIVIENFDKSIKVESVVNWKGRRCPSEGCNIKLDAYFYDWR